MATVVITLNSVCGGGGHANISVTVNGVDKGDFVVWADDILSDITDDEIETFLKLVVRAHKIGKTKAQVRSNLQAGLTVAI